MIWFGAWITYCAFVTWDLGAFSRPGFYKIVVYKPEEILIRNIEVGFKPYIFGCEDFNAKE